MSSGSSALEVVGLVFGVTQNNLRRDLALHGSCIDTVVDFWLSEPVRSFLT